MTEATVPEETDASPLTDLSEALRSSEGEQIRSELMTRLSGLEARIAEALRLGVDSDEYDRLTRLSGAVRSAGSVLAHFV